MGLTTIDAFPHTIATRINYNGRESVKTHAGGFCTIIYVLSLITILVVYTIPVVKRENPTTGSVTKSI